MKLLPKDFFMRARGSWQRRDELSRRGEKEACTYLKRIGYRILRQRFRTRLGEIDIVAQRGNTVSFVEVKTRWGNSRGDPLESVTFRKWHRIQRASMAFMNKYFAHRRDLQLEFLAIGIRWEAGGPRLEAVTLYFD